MYFTLSNDMSADHWSVLGELIKAPHIQAELDRLDVISRTGKIVYSSDSARIGIVNNDPPVGRTYYTQEMAEKDQRRKALCLVRPVLNADRCKQCHEKERKILAVLFVCLKEREPIDGAVRLRGVMTSALFLTVVVATVLSMVYYVIGRKLKI
jgi:hypothetical protein